MPFGKFKGVPFSDLPWGYLGWMMEQDWQDSDVRQLVRWEIIRRLGVDR